VYLTSLPQLQFHEPPDRRYLHTPTSDYIRERYSAPNRLVASEMAQDTMENSCAMRDSCGHKGLFGGDLPCPYSGPPIDVSSIIVPLGF